MLLIPRPIAVGRSFIILAAGLLLAACATSTVESRKKERAAAYATLPPDLKSFVDKGQIKVGMSEDVVYIAWGQPAEILHSESGNAAESTWLYYGGWMEETRYWTYRQTGSGRDIYLERYLDRDYQPRTYVSAEIVFVSREVNRWRTPRCLASQVTVSPSSMRPVIRPATARSPLAACVRT